MEHPAEKIVLDDPRFELRRWRAADADAADRAVAESRDHLAPWLFWAIGHSRDSAVEFVNRCERDWESGDAYNYAITVGGEAIGSISLMRRIAPAGLEIGYWLHPAWTGRGLMTKAVTALTREAFTLPGTDHVEIHHDEANLASGAVPKRLGFTEVGRRPLGPEEPRGTAQTGVLVIWRLRRADAL
ncbi:GNAT family N-acetyltransferase [Allostreptomyces psammosilenae]|uniref:RimJ/RimL family protein N-acetyltransferase n=1 Tax=Allostreptomyces psammosilenae TaxID=1892865 RepID=A0A853A303_9ACTN|nr:GNAT family N-acetyltransferase [Allostreptomyces psammosilenae]NYI07850.1 RimJ/RimL family protein N-acetyltransferase [Allostreptomyces psammosilenae]